MTLVPMLFVDDVEASSKWYQQLLGAQSAHGGPEFETLMLDGRLVLQLHRADAEEHGGPRLPEGATRGAGVLLYVQVPDVRATHTTAVSMRADIETTPSYIDLARHTEFIVRDPDGYALSVFQPGEV
jgi:hypothetical protein